MTDVNNYLVHFSFNLNKADDVNGVRVTVEENRDNEPEPNDDGVVVNNVRSFTVAASGEAGVIEAVAKYVHGPLAIWQVWDDMINGLGFAVFPADLRKPKTHDYAPLKPKLVFRKNARA